MATTKNVKRTPSGRIRTGGKLLQDITNPNAHPKVRKNQLC